MQYCCNDYTINYNECDKEYISDLISYFDDRKTDIFKFFGIEKLSKKLIINLYDSIDKYSEYRNYNLSLASVGNMDVLDDNYYLNILSYKEFIKRKGHENDNLDYMFKTLLHEFIHICQEEIDNCRKSLIWIREGIAIFLSNQYEGLNYKIDSCSIDDLLNDKRVWYINYYSLVKYAFDKYGIDYVKKLVFDYDFCKCETSKLYNELLGVIECMN